MDRPCIHGFFVCCPACSPWTKPAPPPRLLLSIHDELVLECHKEHLAILATMLRRCLTEDMPVDVPLDVTISSGPAWGAVRKLEG